MHQKFYVDCRVLTQKRQKNVALTVLAHLVSCKSHTSSLRHENNDTGYLTG